MKIQPNSAARAAEQTDLRRSVVSRAGTKTTAHRHERRKIREQLRHLDWALQGVD